jgi:UDP-3-O-[3-hydroxymyristoyl] glucosamine N-acyltransferase
MMEKTVKELAEILKGTLETTTPELIITGVNGLQEAKEGQISFAVPPYVEVAGQSKASAIVLPKDGEFTGKQAVIRVENPRAAFADLLMLFRPPEEVEKGVSKFAFVHPTAKIGRDVAILPFAYIAADAVIGDETIIYPHVYVGRHVHIGNKCTLYANVSVREKCQIGNNVILQSGCVIGGDGFGFVTTNGKHTKVLQTGNVVIGDDVEVGCNTCIDRATVDSTIVGKGTKIDNLVHLGHNDIIGENCLLVAHVGISGSVTVGNNCTFGGQAATVGHITIGNNCVFAGRTGVIGNVGDNAFLSGFPAQPHTEWLRQEASLRRVGDLIKKVKQLEKEVNALKTKG